MFIAAVNMIKFLCVFGLFLGLSLPLSSAQSPPDRAPNIVVILADDLGYGDVSSYNINGKIDTPSIDRLAAGGKRFTNAHAPSAMCTPTRYSLLTGRYCWRTNLKANVLFGGGSLIERERVTLAEFLQDNGYKTAMTGKWHLGWSEGKDGIKGGPLDHGFATYFGVTNAPVRAPYVFYRGSQVEAAATAPFNPDWDHLHMKPGKMAPGYNVYDVQQRIVQESIDFLHSVESDASPFFLYVAMTAPHYPFAVAEEFQGTSGLNDYADFVKQMDADVGRILDALEASGKTDDTLVLFTADNGCQRQADFDVLMEKGHNSSAGLRGAKQQIWEGGHQIPFIISWPGKVKAGSQTDALVGIIDIFRTVAAILDKPLPEEQAVDSFDILPELTGEERAGPQRETMVSHSMDGHLAIQSQNWKLIFTGGGGNYNEHRDSNYPNSEAYDTNRYETFQLYNLAKDPREFHNVYLDNPSTVENLTKEMVSIITSGRSTPGASQENEGGNSWEQISWINPYLEN